MGKLIYDSAGSFDIDDRLLAHFRVVAMNKLRRSETFAVQIPRPNAGYVSILVSPSMPMVLHFYGGRPPQLDHDLIEAMMQSAGSPEGLTLTERAV